jgi:hypothetical protein
VMDVAWQSTSAGRSARNRCPSVSGGSRVPESPPA